MHALQLTGINMNSFSGYLEMVLFCRDCKNYPRLFVMIVLESLEYRLVILIILLLDVEENILLLGIKRPGCRVMAGLRM